MKVITSERDNGPAVAALPRGPRVRAAGSLPRSLRDSQRIIIDPRSIPASVFDERPRTQVAAPVRQGVRAQPARAPESKRISMVAPAARNRPSAKNPRLRTKGTAQADDSWKIVVGVIGALLLVVLIAAAASSSGRRYARPAHQPLPQAPSVSPYRPPPPEKLSGLDALGGLTMQEWMQRYGSDNEKLKEQQARVRQFEKSGVDVVGRKVK